MKKQANNPDPDLSAAARLLGRKGGAAGTGQAKARPITSEQARHAVNIRWARYRAAQSPPSKKSA